MPGVTTGVLLATVEEPLRVSVELIVLVVTCSFSESTDVQEVVRKLLAELPAEGTQDVMGTGGAVLTVLQVIAWKPLAALGVASMQEAVATNVVVVSGAQLVTTAFGPMPGVHAATTIGPVLTGVQLICVNKFAGSLLCGTQDAAAIPTELLLVEQVVVVKLLPAFGPLGVQFATGTFVVTTADGQLVVVNALPALGPLALQVATGTFVVITGAGQVVVVQLLADVARLAAQMPATVTDVGTGQVVVV